MSKRRVSELRRSHPRPAMILSAHCAPLCSLCVSARAGSTLLMRVPRPVGASSAAVSCSSSWFSRVSSAHDSMAAESSSDAETSAALSDRDGPLAWNASEWSCVQNQLGPAITLEVSREHAAAIRSSPRQTAL